MGFLGMTSEPVILLYGLVFMINYTVLPQLLHHKICLRENENNITLCQHRNMTIDVQKVRTLSHHCTTIFYQKRGKIRPKEDRFQASFQLLRSWA